MTLQTKEKIFMAYSEYMTQVRSKVMDDTAELARAACIDDADFEYMQLDEDDASTDCMAFMIHESASIEGSFLPICVVYDEETKARNKVPSDAIFELALFDKNRMVSILCKSDFSMHDSRDVDLLAYMLRIAINNEDSPISHGRFLMQFSEKHPELIDTASLNAELDRKFYIRVVLALDANQELHICKPEEIIQKGSAA